MSAKPTRIATPLATSCLAALLVASAVACDNANDSNTQSEGHDGGAPNSSAQDGSTSLQDATAADDAGRPPSQSDGSIATEDAAAAADANGPTNSAGDSSIGGTGQFAIRGTSIIDPDGNEFVPKGANVDGQNWVWNDSTVGALSDIVDCWNFNTVRVNNALTCGSPCWTTNNDLDAIIQAFTAKKVVVILSLHDWTCDYPTGADVTALHTWLTNMAMTYGDKGTKPNPYVWFEPSNEPGGTGNAASLESQWLGLYQPAISTIRQTGASNMIVVDGTNCGQEGGFVDPSQYAQTSAFLQWGDQLSTFGGKTYSNILPSLHVYEQWNSGDGLTAATKLNDFFDDIAAKGWPIFVGEFGALNVDSDAQTAIDGLFQAAVPRKIGALAWHWSGGAGQGLNQDTLTLPGGGYAIDSCTNPTNLSPCEGTPLWQYAHGLAVPPTSCQ